MAFPSIQINNATGSDTAASGAGPAVALAGAAATVTNASAAVTIADAVDLSGVATDGSACLFVNTASGRAFSKITAVAGASGAWTVTVEDTVWTAGAALAWAIGGKRATIDNANTRRAFVDWKAGWSIDVQQTGTNYTLTSAVAAKTTGSTQFAAPATFFSSSAARPLITSTTNSINFFDTTGADHLVVRHLAFSYTAATKGSYAAGTGHAFTSRTGGANGFLFDDCTFDGFTCALVYDNVVNFGARLFVTRCEVKNCVSQGIMSNGYLLLDTSWVHNNGADGVKFSGNPNPFVLRDTVFSGNAGRGVYFAGTGGVTPELRVLAGCSFKGNTNAAVEFADAVCYLFCHDNIFSGNGDTAVKMAAAQATADFAGLLYKNAFYNSTNGNYANCPASVGDVALTADPFVSATDFGLNAAADGGALCKAVGGAAPNVSANPARDLGAVPSGGAAAAATGTGQHYSAGRR